MELFTNIWPDFDNQIFFFWLTESFDWKDTECPLTAQYLRHNLLTSLYQQFANSARQSCVMFGRLQIERKDVISWVWLIINPEIIQVNWPQQIQVSVEFYFIYFAKIC